MTDTARNQAIAQMEIIEVHLSALDMDWEFLEELQDHCEDEDLATLQELTEQSDGFDSRDEVLESLVENPLEIQFRSDWGSHREEFEPHEYLILLCTGGPAVRIRGYLDNHGNPSNAWVEYQDWGTSWTELSLYQSTALEYAQLLIQG